jgi:NAD-dependent deacetylase
MEPLKQAREWLLNANRVAVMTGAGVSAESGVPTFRGSGGIWRGLDATQVATPAAFARDPQLVWDFYNERRAKLQTVEPNPAHVALAKFAKRHHRFTLITQNVDRLHHRAGSENVIELHGNIEEAFCSRCGQTYDFKWVTLVDIPKCKPPCNGLLRPAVVWFGETLPIEAFEEAEFAVAKADVFLVVGTSSVVWPAAGLIDKSIRLGHKVVEVNLDTTTFSEKVSISLHGPAGVILPQILI